MIPLAGIGVKAGGDGEGGQIAGRRRSIRLALMARWRPQLRLGDIAAIIDRCSRHRSLVAGLRPTAFRPAWFAPPPAIFIRLPTAGAGMALASIYAHNGPFGESFSTAIL